MEPDTDGGTKEDQKKGQLCPVFVISKNKRDMNSAKRLLLGLKN